MPTERVTLNLEAKALYAARYAAQAVNLSLSDWLGKVAWEQAVSESARRVAEQERLHPDEPPGWTEYIMDNMFREDEA